MSKLVILIMEGNAYPFGQSDSGYNLKKKIMVRNRIQFDPQNKQIYLTKARFLKKLINPYLIKLQQLLQQDNSLHLLYEYVPIKVETWIQNINVEFIESFKSQLFQFSNFLAQNKIIIKFELKHIGMNQNYQPKYFTGINFQIKQNSNLNALKEQYKRQINNLFAKYTGSQFIQIEKPIEIIQQNKKKQKYVLTNLNCNHTSKHKGQHSYTNVNNSLNEYKTQTPQRHQIKENSEQKPKKSINVFSSLQYKKRIATQTSQNNQEKSKSQIKKTTSMGENQMKEALKDKKNIKYRDNNIKIQNLGEKINALRMMLQSMGNANKQKSSSPMTISNKSKIGGKFFQQKKKFAELSLNNSKYEQNQNFEQQKQLQFDQISQGNNFNHLHQTAKLKRQNQKNMILQKQKLKSGANISNAAQKAQKDSQINNNYYDEFMKILDDDDQVNPEKSFNLEDGESSPFSTTQSSNSKFQPYKQQKQEFDRKSYPRLIKPVKRRDSQTSNDSQIHNRVNEAINVSKKLISSIRKDKHKINANK